MTDTTTAAIIARCDHIEHCAMNQHHQDADRMRALVAERDQLACDAARYRWLRERDLDTIYSGGVFAGQTPENIVLNLEDLDEAVDDAMETGR